MDKQIGIEKKSWYFFRLQELVFEDENLDVYEKAIYAVISKYSDLDTGICYPSIKTIAKKASCSVNKARNCVNKLVKAGYITKKVRKKGKGNFNSNLYKVKDLAYISDALTFARENNDNSLENKILKRLNEHPIPSKKEIYNLINNSNINLNENKSDKELENLYKKGYR